MKSLRLLTAALFGLSALMVAAQVPPTKERGFKPELLYQFGNFDNIALFNGNLTASVALGPTYPVGAGLSYSFVMRYSGNLWRTLEDCHYVQNPGSEDSGCVHVVTPINENGGFGWRLSFGRLRSGQTYYVTGSAPSLWAYVSPDGSEHLFYPKLHNTCSSCEPGPSTVSYTRDGSYLRMKDHSTYRVVEFPNGERHRYDQVGEHEWRLTYMYTAFSSVGASGIPGSNYVRFTYPSSSVANVEYNLKIEDSHGRVHHVTYADSPVAGAEDLVSALDLEAFRNGGTARVAASYTLGYELLTDLMNPALSLVKPCGSPQDRMRAAFLTSIQLPSGESWAFSYKKPADGNSDAQCAERQESAVMLSATLPTGAKIKWDWQPYTFSWYDSDAVGVATRHVEADGADVEYSKYVATVGSTEVRRFAKSQTDAWVLESKSVHKHVDEKGAAFGLPYDPAASPDGGGRRLSSVVYSCDSQPEVSATCTAAREQHVKYEWDYDYFCHIDYPCQQNRNRRVVSEKTKFVDDGNREKTITHSQFDGLGHYRLTTTGGWFTTDPARETFVDYNPDVGTYNASTGAGFTMLDDEDPWILNTFESSYESEFGQTFNTQACFDASTGFLKRKRTLVGSLPGASDLLTVYTPATDGSGFVVSEEHFGGDVNGAPDQSSLCDASLQGKVSTTKINHAWEYGSLKSSQYNGVSFQSADYQIDLGTGLPRTSKDTSGKITTYGYDTSARLASVSPPDLQTVSYEYSNATATAKASVEISTGTGDAQIASEVTFDRLGRVWRESKLMPGNKWSIRETKYDALGRRASVSEPAFDAPSTFLTKFTGYDPFGRPATVTAPDNKTTNFTYKGNRETKRTQDVATSASSETPVAVIEEYDFAGRLVSVKEDADGAAVTTTYEYDAGNRLAGVKMGPAAQPRTFNYDGRGLLVSEVHPESGTTSYEYDGRGKVVKKTTAVATVEYEYDAAERLRLVKSGGLVLKEFVYDTVSGALGKMAKSVRHHHGTSLGTDVTITEDYLYGGLGGRLSKKTTTASSPSLTFVDEYSYDDLGQLNLVKYPACSGCLAPARSIAPGYEHGLLSGVPGYTTATPAKYHPNGMLQEVQYVNANGSAGPKYVQTIENGMSRPKTIQVENYCTDLVTPVLPAGPVIVASGSPANITVNAPGATTFQWFRNDSLTPLPNETSAELHYTITENATFWVRAGNGTCTIDSNRVAVQIQSCPTPSATITVQSTAVASTTLNASVANTPGATYEWSVMGGVIIGSNTTAEITVRAGCSNTMWLTAVVNVGCASDTKSAPVTITPLSISVADPPAIDQGQAATLTAHLTGTHPWTIVWSPDAHTQSNLTASPVSRNVSPTATTTYIAQASDSYGCQALDSAVVTVKPAPPVAFAATASSQSQVQLAWQYQGSTPDQFLIYRNNVLVDAVQGTTLSYVDSVAPGNAYIYGVRAKKANVMSGEARDLATTIQLADVSGGGVVSASHFIELQTAVNRVRALVPGMGDYRYTAGVATGQPVKAVHILDLRTALAGARSALLLPAVSYSTIVGTGAVIDRDDVLDIQRGVK